MSLRYPGGLITKSPTAPTTSAAKGIWTMEQALQYIKAGTWPLSALGDPYFQYNTLLLPGQGTDNTQNNSFLDSGTANSGVGFPISRSGETTQGTFSPFSGANGNWSNYFNGSSDWLQAPANAAFAFGTGNFTVEGWVYVAAVPNTYNTIFDGRTSGTSITGFWLSIGSGRDIILRDNGGNYLTSGGVTIALNTWNHIAVDRNSTTLRLYLNGVVVGSVTNSTNFTDNNCFLNRVNDVTTLNGTQFISNFRIVKGASVYNGAFTPPTAPLGATSGGTTPPTGTQTSLLTCQSNRFVDNGGLATPNTLTPSGTPSVTPFQPFGAPTSAYSASTVGGSGYFDGSGDYLTVSDSNLAPGTGDFTIEMWVYATVTPTDDGIFESRANGTGTAGFTITAFNGSTIRIFCGSALITASSVSYVNTWCHLAVVKSSGTTTFYVNGVSQGTTTSIGNQTETSWVIGAGRYGGTTTPDAFFSGYISGFRYVKGTAVYTTAFTPPTSPPTVIANTSLLYNFTNAGIIDNAQDNDLITFADAKISTAQFKWGTSSISFDGTGDYLTAPAQQNIAFGTGDFTIECWIYFNSVGNAQIASGSSGATTNAFYWQYFSSQLQFGAQGSAAITAASWTPSANTWYHVAVVRTASTIKQYVNGNLLSSASSSQSFVDAVLFVGFGGAGTLNGYVQDLRISKGLCRYPYNFTAPTAALPLFWQAAATPSSDPYFDYTTLLLPGNQPSGVTDTDNKTFKDSSTNNFNITRNGNTTQGTFTPFSQTGWGNYFDGTSDYLTLASSADFNIFGGDMTFECWFYSTAASLGSRSEHLFAFVQDATNRESLYFNGTTLTFWTSSGAGNGPRITYANTPQNQWIHVAVAKSGSTFTMYVNGVSVGTSTTTQYSTSNQSLQIGTYNSAAAGPDSFTGYISNVRVVKGTPVYTTNFIPSTTPLTAVTNTVLLTCQSNRFIDTNTQTTAKTVTPSGDTSVQAFSPFNPTASYSAATVGGSGYFDGTGDFLSLTNNAAFNFGSAAFTIELWYYPTTLSGTQCLITNYGGSTTGFVIQMGGSTPGSGRIDAGFSGDGADITSTNAVRLNSWNHIAISGTPGATGIKLFINGAQEGSTYTGATSLDTSSTLLIGEVASTNRLSGYLCGLRLVKGGALYTATFTPPTSPPTTTVSSGTVSLLTNFTNGAIIDSTAKNDLETVGNAVISTAQSKFGGSSMLFDGTGDWLLMPAGDKFAFGTGDYTVEAWVYFTSITTTDLQIIFLSGSTGGNNFYFHVDGNQISVGTSAAFISNQATSFSTATWYHVAACRYSGTLRLFVNGVQIGSSVSDSTNWISAGSARIGANEAGTQTVFGYINDHRVTKGLARYTTNFTPPTTAFLTL